MDWDFYLELFGYVGTALVLLSMMMTSVVKLRIINICGSIISMIYAIICNTYPVVFLNGGLIIINAIQVVRFFLSGKIFTNIVTDLTDECSSYFLKFHKDDILKFTPNFNENLSNENKVRIIYSGAEMAGIFIYTQKENNLCVVLDYTTPKFRDTSVAKYLFDSLKNEGVKKITSNSASKTHNNYLKKMGFVFNNTTWEKNF